MFTGLVEGIGRIARLRRRAGLLELRLRCPFPLDEVRRGDSIAVQGVCLTAVDFGEDETILVHAVGETLGRTTLGNLRVGDPVHLERALRIGDRLGGHLVEGHVDGIGRVRRLGRSGGGWILDVGLPRSLNHRPVEKGSICIDGVSLTVAKAGTDWVRIAIVPATASATLLTSYRSGRDVNIEIDTIAKHVASILKDRQQSGSNEIRGIDSNRIGSDGR